MAGDWIKMRNDLPEDPAVIGIAASLDVSECSVVGMLHMLWAWFDRQSRDGHARGVTKTWIDRLVQRDGFSNALISAGWLVATDDGITIPNFERHNGKTAKTRALAGSRKEKERSENVTEMSRTQRDKRVTREEKRRDKEHAQKSEPARFIEFYALYPRKVAKDKALKAWNKKKLDAEAESILADVRRRIGTDEWRDEQFIPYPATYLNDQRWSDDAAPGDGQSAWMAGVV